MTLELEWIDYDESDIENPVLLEKILNEEHDFDWWLGFLFIIEEDVKESLETLKIPKKQTYWTKGSPLD